MERYYRLEGKKKDRVAALPSHFDTSALRVYFLDIKGCIMIMGNGGLKKTRTYNEDFVLTRCVEVLQKVDTQFRLKEISQDIRIDGCNLKGNLTLEIDI